eukprot:921344-Prorocentrum_minimum.AAC.1
MGRGRVNIGLYISVASQTRGFHSPRYSLLPTLGVIYYITNVGRYVARYVQNCFYNRTGPCAAMPHLSAASDPGVRPLEV